MNKVVAFMSSMFFCLFSGASTMKGLSLLSVDHDMARIYWFFGAFAFIAMLAIFEVLGKLARIFLVAGGILFWFFTLCWFKAGGGSSWNFVDAIIVSFWATVILSMIYRLISLAYKGLE